MKQLKNQRGLTLIELLAVIVILAIIAAIAAVAIGNVIQNSKDKGVLSDATNIIAGAKIAHMDGACVDDKDGKSAICKNLVTNGFVEDGIAEDLDTKAEVKITYASGKSNTAPAGTKENNSVTYAIKWEDGFKEIKNDKYKVGEAKDGKGYIPEKTILEKLNGGKKAGSSTEGEG